MTPSYGLKKQAPVYYVTEIRSLTATVKLYPVQVTPNSGSNSNPAGGS